MTVKEAVTITLNGVEVSGYDGMTILDLAQESGVEIPTLCRTTRSIQSLNPAAASRRYFGLERLEVDSINSF